MLIRGSYLPQKIKIGSRLDEYTAHSDQREDGDENLVAAGNSRGSEYLDFLYCFLFMFLCVFSDSDTKRKEVYICEIGE